MIILLSKSTNKEKKFMVLINDENTRRTIHFGSSDHSDYTLHKDPDRKKRYIARHKAKEDWTKNGILTAGFWSRWILWNEPTLEESIKSTEKKFSIRITFNV
jgi:hypothetical protein